MKLAHQLVEALLEGDEDMLHGMPAEGPGPGAQPPVMGREQRFLAKIKDRFIRERTEMGASPEQAAQAWAVNEPRFIEAMKDPEVRQRHGLDVRESCDDKSKKPMPDWLKRIKGIKDDDDDDAGEGKSEDEPEGESKESKPKSDSSGSSDTTVGKTW